MSWGKELKKEMLLAAQSLEMVTLRTVRRWVKN